MKLLIVITTAAGLLATANLIAQDRTFDRTLNVSSTPNVSVATGSGSIHLHQGSDNQVHIAARVHANHDGEGSSDVESRIQQIVANPPIVQNGNIITIGERKTKTSIATSISLTTSLFLAPPRSAPLLAPARSTFRMLATTSKPRPVPAPSMSAAFKALPRWAQVQAASNSSTPAPAISKLKPAAAASTLTVSPARSKPPPAAATFRSPVSQPPTGGSLPAAAPYIWPSATPKSISTPTPAQAPSRSPSPSPCKAASTAITSPASSTAAAPSSTSAPAPAISSSSSLRTPRAAIHRRLMDRRLFYPSPPLFPHPRINYP